MNKYISAILLFTLFASSCKKQLEISPAQSIESSTALSTSEGVGASITGIYSLLKSARLYGRDLIALPEALADNGFANNRSGRFLNEAQSVFPNAVSGANHFSNALWALSYSAINQINATLVAIPSLNVIPAPSAAQKASWEGQLYFLRGLYYFELMRAYAYIPGAVITIQDKGGVPITPNAFTTIEQAIPYKPSRAPIVDVYNYIIADLLKAEAGLAVSGEKSLATKAAARAMLSRVYLYNKDYANAKLWSDNTITTFGASNMTDQTDFVSNWRLADHKETIFQVKFTVNAESIGVNESNQTAFTTLTAPGLVTVTGGFGDLVPSITLLNDLGITLVGGNTSLNFTGSPAVVATRNTDVRNLLFEPGTAGRGKSYIECTKFLGKNGFINLDNVPVIRLTEMYLNRAEAQSTPGSSIYNEPNALSDLKFVKGKRYAGYVGSAIETADNLLTGTALYNEILRQERIEFAYEGHRFFDLKRLGKDIIKSAPYTNFVFFTESRILPPLPISDVDGNINLSQNFGY